MSRQNAINRKLKKTATSKELMGSLISQLLPALESVLSAAVVNTVSLQLTTLATSPTISKKDFASINGISSAVLEKWIANGVVLLAPTPSSTVTQQRKCGKTGQTQTIVMERHGNALINLEAWREKNRQQAIKCRYINR
ncbi:Uncharacterised protein [Yersinia intermedia]|uniref:hypothetical protein n=1 Tax=Yersinia intermedia TaxID=631 RepID=UPI0005E42889|nr:hypothetical protein [Yersinia intermedia]MDA5510722.1 hypothetical protein [Yersinia intermedia]CQD74043.1 Uncharacterised protein [Yersinia intermedia]